ncbi:DegT/DnrJ/EryC1/StrS family aminotransferase [Pelagibacteraceae bacterium]|nr:DegT/DnrJ/EryC1/StrS family aminotransferase [Pelagibacteraceae bacterium]
MYDLNKHYQSNKKEILQSIDKILNNGVLEMGEEVEKFEENFSKYCGVKYSVTVSSGSMGILLALKALNLKDNDEVMTVANSDIPTSHAISLARAKIKWIDVCEETFNIDTKLLDKSINKKSKVILPVHLFGNPAEMSKIQLIAKKNNLLVIEDACLATGAEYNKKKIGSLSDLCVFSTNPGKVLDGIGPGGIITTNNKKLFITLKKLRDYGRRSRPSKWPVKSDLIGYNSKMSSINAAVLNIRLRYLDMYIEKRNQNALMYMDLLDSKKIKFQKVLYNSKSAWRTFTIRVRNRNQIYSELYDKNFKVALGYLPINYKDVCYKKLGKKLNLKNTEKISTEIINLPCHPYISKKEIVQISKNILSLV